MNPELNLTYQELYDAKNKKVLELEGKNTSKYVLCILFFTIYLYLAELRDLVPEGVSFKEQLAKGKKSLKQDRCINKKAKRAINIFAY